MYITVYTCTLFCLCWWIKDIFGGVLSHGGTGIRMEPSCWLLSYPSSVSLGRPRHQVASKTWRGDELKNFLRGRREGEPEKPFETQQIINGYIKRIMGFNGLTLMISDDWWLILRLILVKNLDYGCGKPDDIINSYHDWGWFKQPIKMVNDLGMVNMASWQPRIITLYGNWSIWWPPSIAMSLPWNRNPHVQGPGHMGESETGVHSQLWLF